MENDHDEEVEHHKLGNRHEHDKVHGGELGAARLVLAVKHDALPPLAGGHAEQCEQGKEEVRKVGVGVEVLAQLRVAADLHPQDGKHHDHQRHERQEVQEDSDVL